MKVYLEGRGSMAHATVVADPGERINDQDIDDAIKKLLREYFPLGSIRLESERIPRRSASPSRSATARMARIHASWVGYIATVHVNVYEGPSLIEAKTIGYFLNH